MERFHSLRQRRRPTANQRGCDASDARPPSMFKPPASPGGGHRARDAGFSVLELSIALTVFALLASMAIGVVGAAQDLKRAESRRLQLEQARAAIYQFARVNFRLPCPDLTGSGFEGDASGKCVMPGNFGGLPFRTLGMEPGPVANGSARTPSSAGVTEVIRFGVFRAPLAADLSAPQPVFSRWPAHERLSRLAAAAAAASPRDQPFVPAPDAVDATQTDCAAPGSSPAFVISIGPSDQLGSGACFAVPDKATGAFTSVSRAEFVGWSTQTGG